MNDNFILIISPDGNYYKSNVDNKGHGIKLINYFELYNLDYNKEESLFLPSQYYAFILSNMGYIVFLIGNGLNSIFLSENNFFTEEQIITFMENEDEIRNVLKDKIIPFNKKLLDELNESHDNFNTIVEYLNSHVAKKIKG